MEEGGNVAEAICRMADQLGVDVVCLSSHGRTGLARVLVESTASGVLARSSRPVLIVKPAGLRKSPGA